MRVPQGMSGCNVVVASLSRAGNTRAGLVQRLHLTYPDQVPSISWCTGLIVCQQAMGGRDT